MKHLHIIFALAFTMLLFSNKDCKASHAAGADLIYEWISGTQYVVTFKFYRDCTGIPEQPNVQLCILNGCTNTIDSKTLPKIVTLPDGRPNGSQVATGCPGFPNKCEDASATLPGYREWWYRDTIVLNGRCNKWRFSVSINARNGSQNLANGGNLYIEATLDNANVDHNNSTVFYTKPVPYVCLSQPYTFNNGAIDKDNDALLFEVAQPLNHGGCAATPATVMTFRTATPPLSLPNNPFQTNNTYTLNSSTGQINYTAAQLGAHTTTIRVKEYRGGILVGSTMRDIQVQVQPCTTTPIDLDVDTNSLVNSTLINGSINACINRVFTFCFDIKASDTDALVVVSDNSKIVIPASSITYTNNGQDSVRGCFSWFPQIADSGLKVLTITAKDSTCKAPGISIAQVFTIPLDINTHAPAPKVNSPVELCQNIVAAPLTANGTNLRWYTTPVGGTFSSTAPVPNTTTVGQQVFYVSHVPNGCESERRPIFVNVSDFPSAAITAEKDTICAFEDVIIASIDASAPETKYVWNTDTGKISYQADTFIKAYWKNSGLKTIRLTVKNKDCATNDSTTLYVLPSPIAQFDIIKNSCVGTEVKLIPAKDENALYFWNVDGHNLTNTQYNPVYSLNWNDTGKKYIRLSTQWNDGRNDCINSYIDSITIHDFPIADIANLTDGDICFGKEFRFRTPEGYRYSYDWEPPQFFNNNDAPEVTGTAETSGYIYVHVNNTWDCIATDSIFITAAPCCEIAMPDAFTPNGDGVNDFYQPMNGSQFKIENFIIANRRGQIVFNNISPSAGWDGTHNGEESGIDTYNYYIKYTCNDETVKEKKGTILLIR